MSNVYGMHLGDSDAMNGDTGLTEEFTLCGYCSKEVDECGKATVYSLNPKFGPKTYPLPPLHIYFCDADCRSANMALNAEPKEMLEAKKLFLACHLLTLIDFDDLPTLTSATGITAKQFNDLATRAKLVCDEITANGDQAEWVNETMAAADEVESLLDTSEPVASRAVPGTITAASMVAAILVQHNMRQHGPVMATGSGLTLTPVTVRLP